MNVEDFTLDGHNETRVLAGMAALDPVCGRVAAVWDGHLFDSTDVNLAAGLCVEYHKLHGRAPGTDLESIYAAAAVDWNAEQQRGVARLLESVSDMAGRGLNADHILNLASRCFRRTRLLRTLKEAEGAAKRGLLDNAEGLVAGYRRPEVGGGDTGVYPYHDEGAVLAWFAQERLDNLFKFDDALDDFFRGQLVPGGLVAFLAPPKTGKSFWLQEIVHRTVLARKKVAWYQVGDMTENEVGLRLIARVAGRPFESQTGKWPYTIRMPTRITPPRAGEDSLPMADVSWREETFNSAISPQEAWAYLQAAKERDVKSRRKFLHLKTYPNDSVTWLGIKAHLELLEQEEFVPDVVVIDYADLLAAVDKRSEKRHQVNDTWKGLRRLSQERHCLVVTATQARREGYDKNVLTRQDVNEDRRINDHVTALIGLHAKEAEKERGIFRLNQIHKRKGRVRGGMIYVAGCLDVARPAVVSTW